MSLIQNLKERVIQRFGAPNQVKESPDPTPLAPPVGYKAAPSLAEQIREMVRSERLAADIAAAGHETFEEADDFDIDDDIVVNSPWENEFDPSIAELTQAGKAEIDKRAAQPSSSPPQPNPADPPKAEQPKNPGEAGASDPK